MDPHRPAHGDQTLCTRPRGVARRDYGASRPRFTRCGQGSRRARPTSSSDPDKGAVGAIRCTGLLLGSSCQHAATDGPLWQGWMHQVPSWALLVCVLDRRWKAEKSIRRQASRRGVVGVGASFDLHVGCPMIRDPWTVPAVLKLMFSR